MAFALFMKWIFHCLNASLFMTVVAVKHLTKNLTLALLERTCV